MTQCSPVGPCVCAPSHTGRLVPQSSLPCSSALICGSARVPAAGHRVVCCVMRAVWQIARRLCTLLCTCTAAAVAAPCVCVCACLLSLLLHVLCVVTCASHHHVQAAAYTHWSPGGPLTGAWVYCKGQVGPGEQGGAAQLRTSRSVAPQWGEGVPNPATACHSPGVQCSGNRCCL